MASTRAGTIFENDREARGLETAFRVLSSNTSLVWITDRLRFNSSKTARCGTSPANARTSEANELFRPLTRSLRGFPSRSKYLLSDTHPETTRSVRAKREPWVTVRARLS
jgi:hypothetical protein